MEGAVGARSAEARLRWACVRVDRGEVVVMIRIDRWTRNVASNSPDNSKVPIH